MTTGRLIGVVGPSGVGKDSVMSEIAARCDAVRLVRRVTTRAPALGGEAYEPVDEAEFEARVQAGVFALHWRAHGLRYGVPVTVEQDLAAGYICLVNLSRSVLADAQALFKGFTVLHLTAPQDVLAARLAARGRESSDGIEDRLARAGFALPDGLTRVLHLSNTGPLDETAARALDAVYPERVMR